MGENNETSSTAHFETIFSPFSSENLLTFWDLRFALVTHVLNLILETKQKKEDMAGAAAMMMTNFGDGGGARIDRSI